MTMSTEPKRRGQVFERKTMKLSGGLTLNQSSLARRMRVIPAWCRIVSLALLAVLAVAIAPIPGRSAATLQQSPSGPHIYLREGKNLAVKHVGSDHALQMLNSGQAEPLSMAQGDFHEDGIPGLVVGYRANGANLLVVHEGNLDAFAPQSQQSWEALRDGSFPSPFRSEANAFEVPGAA